MSGALDVVAKALRWPTPLRLPRLASGPDKAVRRVNIHDPWYYSAARGGPPASGMTETRSR